jgi:hypothetical protein
VAVDFLWTFIYKTNTQLKTEHKAGKKNHFVVCNLSSKNQNKD